MTSSTSEGLGSAPVHLAGAPRGVRLGAGDPHASASCPAPASMTGDGGLRRTRLSSGVLRSEQRSLGTGRPAAPVADRT